MTSNQSNSLSMLASMDRRSIRRRSTTKQQNYTAAIAADVGIGLAASFMHDKMSGKVLVYVALNRVLILRLSVEILVFDVTVLDAGVHAGVRSYRGS